MPEREPLKWTIKKKWEAMHLWADTVQADPELSRSDLKVAWALMFAFNSYSGRCWSTVAVIADSAGRVSKSLVKAALAHLEERGHILRRNETIHGKVMRVIYPTISPEAGTFEPRKRKGGVAKGVDPRALAEARRGIEDQHPVETDVQAPGGTQGQHPPVTEVQYPSILEGSLNDPRGFAASGTTAPPILELDDWELEEEERIPPPPVDDDWDDLPSIPKR